MKTFTFQFDDGFPPKVRELVEPLLNETQWLFPLWMQKAIITWDKQSDTEAMVGIHVHKDYRWCRIIFFADFLSQPPDVQLETVYHEIVHCYNVPLKKVACDILDNCIGDEQGEMSEKLQTAYRKQIDYVMESITQDLAFVITEKFNER
jgi:hypothetical protein